MRRGGQNTELMIALLGAEKGKDTTYVGLCARRERTVAHLG